MFHFSISEYVLIAFFYVAFINCGFLWRQYLIEMNCCIDSNDVKSNCPPVSVETSLIQILSLFNRHTITRCDVVSIFKSISKPRAWLIQQFYHHREETKNRLGASLSILWDNETMECLINKGCLKEADFLKVKCEWRIQRRSSCKIYFR